MFGRIAFNGLEENGIECVDGVSGEHNTSCRENSQQSPKTAQDHKEAAGKLLEQDSSHKTQIQNQKKMARKVAKEGKQKARKRMGTTEKDHRGVNRQISVFIVAEKKEDMPQLMALPINTQLETNCGLNEHV